MNEFRDWDLEIVFKDGITENYNLEESVRFENGFVLIWEDYGVGKMIPIEQIKEIRFKDNEILDKIAKGEIYDEAESQRRKRLRDNMTFFDKIKAKFLWGETK